MEKNIKSIDSEPWENMYSQNMLQIKHDIQKDKILSMNKKQSAKQI